MPLDQFDIEEEKDEKKDKRDEMSFWEHLNELRTRIIRALLAVMIASIIVFLAKDFVMNNIIFAPRYKTFVTYKFMCQIAEKTGLSGLCIKPVDFDVTTRDIGEPFFKHMQISLVLGLVIAIPFVFWQLWLFIKPGLMAKEIKAARGFVTICSALFVAGVLFGYYIITPFAISFLTGYTLGDIKTMPTLASYIDYMTMFTLPIGLVFELPIIIFFLSKLGIVTSKMLKQYRKHMVVILLIVAGIITPSPDIVSQLLVGIPLYLLYEIGIIVSARVEKKRKSEMIEQQ